MWSVKNLAMFILFFFLGRSQQSLHSLKSSHPQRQLLHLKCLIITLARYKVWLHLCWKTLILIIVSLIYVFLFKFIYFFLWQLEVQYFHDHATLTTAVALNQSPAIDVSATIGTPSIAFGAEAGYDTTTGNFTKYTAGLSVAKPDSSASIIL